MKRLACISMMLPFLWVAGAADFRITQIRRDAQGITIAWNAVVGRAYTVDTAAVAAGPWTARVTMSATGPSLSWTDAEVGSIGQRFYRVSTSDPAVRQALSSVDTAPVAVVNHTIQSRDTAANAMYLASVLQGSGQLVTNGTLTELGQNWSYASLPEDRLQVHFQSGTNVDFYIQRVQGDLTGDASTFLRRGHDFRYRVVQPGVLDLNVTSVQSNTNCDIHGVAVGTIQFSNTTYTINLDLSGLYCVESDTGFFSLLSDLMITGSMSAGEYSLTVEQRRRFELIVNAGESASSSQDWLNSQLAIGNEVYRWNNANKQKSFRNGRPSSVDTYWRASGGVLRNGAPFGTYQFRDNTGDGLVKFLLILPGETIELESWRL